MTAKTRRKPDRLLLSMQEVEDSTGLSRWLLYKLDESGELPLLKIGKRRMIRPADLDAYIKRLAAEVVAS